MSAFDPGRYLRYDEMTAWLQSWAAQYPGLCRLEEIGRSAEGRAIWAVTLTNTATGSDREKPGYMVDANIHAGEVTGGATAMYTIHWLLTGYGVDPVATEILDTRAFYVIPRISVDGAEVYLTTPHMLRSSPKLYPVSEELPGLYPDDVNGDGLILNMRMIHPDGDWKADNQDSRLMVRRQPEDREGTFYKVYTEGTIKDWDGHGVPMTRRPWGLDFNRNFPAFWNPEGKQPGAGAFPLSEPETRTVAAFLISHPNVGAYVAYHTTGGVLLRPPSNGGDEKINSADLETFKRIGDVCTRITGYPCKSTYQAFSFPGQEALVKGADDWAYEHYGVQAYTMELWNPDLRSGGKGYAQLGVKGMQERSEADVAEAERKKLAWQDAELGGKGFIPWAPFEHPQLGPVEIGGWDAKRALQNPPEGELLVQEISKAAAFTFQHALATPRLAVSLTAERLGAGLFKVTAKVTNLGGLSTNVTQVALAGKIAPAITVSLSGATVVSGKPKTEIGHLEGWAMSGGRPANSEAWVDWIVRAEPGAQVAVNAATPRAGKASAEITL